MEQNIQELPPSHYAGHIEVWSFTDMSNNLLVGALCPDRIDDAYHRMNDEMKEERMSYRCQHGETRFTATPIWLTDGRRDLEISGLSFVGVE